MLTVYFLWGWTMKADYIKDERNNSRLLKSQLQGQSKSIKRHCQS